MRIWIILLLTCLCASAQLPVIPFNAASTQAAAAGGALTIVQTNFVSCNNSVGATAWLTNTLSVTSGNVLVLLCANELATVRNGVLADNHSMVWTLQARAQHSSSGDCEIWTAPVGFTGSVSITNTFGLTTGDTKYGRSQCIFEISGQETTQSGAAGTNTAQATPLVNLTTTRANSLILGVVSDFAAKAPPCTYRAGNIQAKQHDNTTSVYRADYFYLQPTTATSYACGETAPAAQQSGICVYEIRTP